MKLTKRFRNWITTVIGTIVVVFAGVAFWFGKVNVLGFVGFVLLGWALISAKDTLLEGLTMGIFKGQEKE